MQQRTIPGRAVYDVTLPPRGHLARILARGQTLRITDLQRATGG